jgi:hypothetical protein
METILRRINGRIKNGHSEQREAPSKTFPMCRKRASHEWKNGEMKRFHGLDCARGYGLKSMNMQTKLIALAVNLKKMVALVSFFA